MYLLNTKEERERFESAARRLGERCAQEAGGGAFLREKLEDYMEQFFEQNKVDNRAKAEDYFVAVFRDGWENYQHLNEI